MASCLLPVRLGLLTGHLVLTALLLSNRDVNVRLCLAWDWTAEEYHRQDVELLVGLILSLVLTASETVFFLAGCISMLHRKQSLFSSCQHGLGSLVLASFMWDGWQCGLWFWYLFAACVAAPFITEIVTMLTHMAGQNQRQQRLQS